MEERKSGVVKRAGILPGDYTKEYYFSEEYSSSDEYKQFIKGGMPARIYLNALNYLPKNAKGPFLDIGCGKGEIVTYLARLCKEAVGIDYSKSAIEICQTALKNEKYILRNYARFYIADITKLPFKDETFEYVFLLDVIEHLTYEQMTQGIDEIKRVLKKGGKVIIHTNNKYFERGTKLFISMSYHGPKVFLHPKKYLCYSSGQYEYMHINYLTPEQLEKHFVKKGFQTMVGYPKQIQKDKLGKYIPYSKRWKKIFYTNIGWALLNSRLIKFFSPTFWIIAAKKY